MCVCVCARASVCGTIPSLPVPREGGEEEEEAPKEPEWPHERTCVLTAVVNAKTSPFAWGNPNWCPEASCLKTSDLVKSMGYRKRKMLHMRGANKRTHCGGYFLSGAPECVKTMNTVKMWQKRVKLSELLRAARGYKTP